MKHLKMLLLLFVVSGLCPRLHAEPPVDTTTPPFDGPAPAIQPAPPIEIQPAQKSNFAVMLDASEPRTLNLEVSEFGAVVCPGNIRSVTDFDSKIISVSAENAQRLKIQGKSIGKTYVQVRSGDGQHYSLIVSVSPAAGFDALEAVLARFYPDAHVEMFPVNESLLLQGSVAKQEHIPQITEIAEQYVEKVLNHLKVDQATGAASEIRGGMSEGPGPVLEDPPARRNEPLVDVRVEGNLTIPTRDIAKYIKSRSGRPADPDQIREDIRTLYGTGWFLSVDSGYRRTDAGLMLVFKVIERPSAQHGAANVASLETKESEVQELRRDIQALHKDVKQLIELLKHRESRAPKPTGKPSTPTYWIPNKRTAPNPNLPASRANPLEAMPTPRFNPPRPTPDPSSFAPDSVRFRAESPAIQGANPTAAEGFPDHRDCCGADCENLFAQRSQRSPGNHAGRNPGLRRGDRVGTGQSDCPHRGPFAEKLQSPQICVTGRCSEEIGEL